jgi:hypothetical protein
MMTYIQMPTTPGRPPTPPSMRDQSVRCAYCHTGQQHGATCAQCGAPLPAAIPDEDRPKPKPPVQPTPHNTIGRK